MVNMYMGTYIAMMFGLVVAVVLLAVLLFYAHPTNCSSFKSREEAYAFYSANPVKYKALDRDNDGIPCEKLK